MVGIEPITLTFTVSYAAITLHAPYIYKNAATARIRKSILVYIIIGGYIMIKLYTEEEFKSSKSRDKLKLQCYECNNVFLKEKHYIQKAIRGLNKSGVVAKFCSRTCQRRNQQVL